MKDCCPPSPAQVREGLGEDWIVWIIVGALETGVPGAVLEMGKCFERLHIL